MSYSDAPSSGIVDDPSARAIRVLLVDDDPLVRAGLTMILGGAGDIVVVGEAADGVEAVDQAPGLRPDVVLMDLRMPAMNGLDATLALRRAAHPPRVIVLTTFDADDDVVRALAAGAAGFLLKDTSPPDIVAAIRRVHAGEPMLSPQVTATLIRHVAGPGSRDTAGASGAAAGATGARSRLSRLSEREREVAVAVGHGKSNADIAAELFMSVPTVKSYVSKVLVKLDASNRTQIALMVHDAGLV